MCAITAKLRMRSGGKSVRLMLRFAASEAAATFEAPPDADFDDAALQHPPDARSARGTGRSRCHGPRIQTNNASQKMVVSSKSNEFATRRIAFSLAKLDFLAPPVGF